MNQASLHQINALENQDLTKANALNKLFKQRLSSNLPIIKDLFFSLYPGENHTTSFKKLLLQLPALFKERPTPLKLQDIHRLKQGDWYQSEQLVGMQLYVGHFSKDRRQA